VSNERLLKVYPNLERISENDFWKLTICPECNALIYKYQTKEGKIMCVSVIEGMFFHRYGNNNNYVARHECGYDERQGNLKKCYVNVIEVTEEVKDKVKGSLQQQAVMRCLTEFSKKNVRSNFKKSMLHQAQKFLNGETGYKNPFSPKQVFCIISDMISTIEPTKKPTPKKHIELNLRTHVLTFATGTIITVHDKERSGKVIRVTSDGHKHKLNIGYLKARQDIIEYIYTCDYTFSHDETTNYYHINDVVE
jgi:hypothetical protein